MLCYKMPVITLVKHWYISPDKHFVDEQDALWTDLCCYFSRLIQSGTMWSLSQRDITKAGRQLRNFCNELHVKITHNQHMLCVFILFLQHFYKHI